MLRLTSILVRMNSNGNFLVYKSSAGSGKTYTLVKEYLSIALSSNNPERYKNILAMTFTNKAAAEMKDRVTLYLKSFCEINSISGGEALMFENLLELLDIKQDQLRERAFRMLQSILHNYSDFNITTIDKFILKIIRSFSFDLQLPYNFEVELDSESLLNQAINNLLAETGKDQKLTVFLVNYIKQLAQNDESWNIQSSLLNVAKISMNEEALPHLNQIQNLKLEDFAKIKENLKREIRQYEEFIRLKLKTGKERLKSSGLVPDQLKGKTRTNVWAYFNGKISSKSFEECATPKYHENIENEEWGGKGFEGSIPIEIQTELQNLFIEIEEYKSKNIGAYILKINVDKNIFQLGLVNELEKQVNQIREEQNFIHISEFNKKVAEVVIEQPIPFIYERIGEKFTNYLIDEFQDTSILQWQNLLPLIENSLAYDNKNLIVGDAKQAIYRWRGGDVDQFALLPEAPQFKDNDIIQERIKTLKRHFNPLTLDSNYRSKKEIIEFNNLFFKELLTKLPEFFGPYYAEYEQEIGIEKTGGYAQIKILPKDEYSDLTLNEIRENINDCVKRGKQLNDIAILTKRNKDLTLIAGFLTQNGIPVISNESLNLNQSKEVNFLVNIYSCILDNKDLNGIIKTCGFLNDIKPIDYFSIFNNKNNAFQTLELIINNKFKIRLPGILSISLYEGFEELISEFKIKKSDPFIQTFLDVVKQQSSLLSASEFLDFWNEKKESLKIASPQNVKAVTLMTIHKSKGLEFPVVILPFANTAPMRDSWLWLNTSEEEIGIGSSLAKNNKKMLNTEFSDQSEQEKLKTMLDELNVVYVALTRAADELFISISEEKKPNEIKGIETFFHQVIASLDKKEGDVFSYGTKVSVEEEEKEKLSSQTDYPDLKDGNWREKIKISFSAPAIWNVPETSEEAFKINDPRKFGNLIHIAFARLKHSDETELISKQLYQEGLIEEINIASISNILNKSLKLEPLKQVWNKGNHIVEKEIISDTGISYRPDRIIEYNKTTYLIDFKTGEQKEGDKKQILNYAILLKQLKFNNIRCFLIYTDESKSIEIK